MAPTKCSMTIDMGETSTYHFATSSPMTCVELSSKICLTPWIGRCVRILDGRVTVACDRSKAFGVLIACEGQNVRVQIGGFSSIEVAAPGIPIASGTLLSSARNGTVRPATVGDYVFGCAVGRVDGENKVRVKLGDAAVSSDLWQISRESIRLEMLQHADEDQGLHEFERAVDVVWRIRNGRR